MKYLYKNSTCLCTKGFQRGVILDFNKNKYFLSSNYIIDYIENFTPDYHVNDQLNKVFKTPESQDLKFLIENEIICSSKLLFKNEFINLSYDFHSKITNCIVEYHSLDVFLNCLIQIEAIGCNNLQLFVSKNIDIYELKLILKNIDNTLIKMLEVIVFSLDGKKQISSLKKVFLKNVRLYKLIIGSSPLNERIYIDQFKIKYIDFRNDKLSYFNCGAVHPIFFTNNLTFFTESQCHNTCLNRKLCIDQYGEIKNCPAMAKSYGNVKDTALKELISNPEFQELWTISKDQIDVCKDCEFRHMCMDCRAFIKDPENIYSQPAKCTYNPYICKWDGQDGYVPVEECGTYSRETGFVPDIEKINKFNKLIWGEDE